MTAKRSYTVPVLLVVATVLLFVIVVVFSKLLLTEQSAKTDKGMRLASNYSGCILFADGLNHAVGDLAASVDAAGRLEIKQKIGQTAMGGMECSSLLYQAQKLDGASDDQAAVAVNVPMQAIWDKLQALGNHDGPLTDKELAAAKTIQASGAEMAQTLQQYAVPTGGDRYRQMAAGVDWPDTAMHVLQQVQQLADSLK